MKLLSKYIVITFILSLVVAGCSKSPVETGSQKTETLVYEKPGLVDSITGTCSAYIVHTLILDSLDLSGYDEIKIEMNSYTDGDLSNVTLYYLRDTAVNIFSLNGSGNINNTASYSATSPKTRIPLYLRLRLFSSVCTGQYFHLKMHNLRIYGVN